MQLVTKIKLYGKPYTTCYIHEDDVVFPNADICRALGLGSHNSCDIYINSEEEISAEDTVKKKSLRLVTNAYFLLPFLKECQVSDVFRWNMLNNLQRLSGNAESETVFLKLVLKPPDKEILDYAWNDRMLKLVWTRVEVENAFSWLSTLGGAYSALGDYFGNCAEEAGRISGRQYKLSIMLGDDSLAARSKLYSAISIAQQGNLKLSRHIVRQVADFARQTKDRRLIRMCQGVWAKLRYMRMIQKQSKQHQIKDDGDKNIDSFPVK